MKNLKLTYDARMLFSSGIGTQVQNVTKLLSQNEHIDLHLFGNQNEINSFLPDFQGKITDWNAPIYSIKEQFSIPDPGKDSILHIPHYNASIRYLNRSIIVVHDLIHLQSEEFASIQYRLYTNTLLSLIAKKALRIITVSETTKQEYIMRYPAAEKKIDVIHNGLDHTLFYPPDKKLLNKFKKKYTLPDQFILIVGIGKKHKNVDFVIRTLAPLWKSHKLKMPLVLGGTGGVIPEYIAREIQINRLENHIIALPRLSVTELSLMYGAARILIMPSLLEGFGFPVIEAMACGTPVLCSNASSLPEIAGNAALLFDPRSSADLTNNLLQLLENQKLATDMKNKGITRASHFSWQKHISELIKVYYSVL